MLLQPRLICIFFIISISIVFGCRVEELKDEIVDIRGFSVDLSQFDQKISIVDGVYMWSDSNKPISADVKSKDQSVSVVFESGRPDVKKTFQYPFILKSEHNYKDGLEHGVQTGWHQDGQLSYKYNALGGIIDGQYLEYYPNGNIQIDRLHQNGKVVSEKIWNMNKKILVNYVIKDGRYYGLLGSSNCITIANSTK